MNGIVFNILIDNLIMTYQQQYTEKEFIGRGNYGKVYLVYHNKTLDFHVAKKISLEGLKFQQVDRTMREIEIHKQLKHPNIIAFKEYFLEDDILIIIMEYCEYGDLSVYIKNRQESNEYFEEPLIMNLFIQLLLGVQYLHQRKIVHRDIKPQNIFINEEGVLKLADFGISKAMEYTQEKAMTLVGTPYYLSPQACKDEGYTGKSDIWALGCVLYQLCALKHAFQGSNVLFLANKITHDEIQNIPHISKELFQLIQLLLSKDPSKRPTINQIFDNNYVKIYMMNFSRVELEPFVQSQKEKQEGYQNQFMPNYEKEYANQFLEDEKFHPKNSLNSTTETITLKKDKSSSNMQQTLSPRKNGTQKLKQKCIKHLGQPRFNELYSLMRKLKSQGLSQIQVSSSSTQIQSKLKQKYKKSDFDHAMDIAQLIYIQDNY